MHIRQAREGKLMVDYIRSHYKRATFFMIAMLCAAGLSAGAFVAVKTLASEREEEATLSITNARAALVFLCFNSSANRARFIHAAACPGCFLGRSANAVHRF